mgnify:CR=1 FL=1
MIHVEYEHIPALKQTYEENSYPVDRLVCDEPAMRGFRIEVCRRLDYPYSIEALKETLLHLRKDKDGTGGLPRVGRNWNGPRWRADD